MELVLSNGSAYILSLEEQFALAKEAGFTGLEYVVNENHVPGTASRLATLIEKHDLPIRNIHAPFQQVEGWNGPVSSLLATVSLARKLGAQSITFHPPHRAMEDVTFHRWMVDIDDFQEEIGGGDVLVTVENMPRVKSWRGVRVPFTTAPYRYQERDELYELLEERNLYLTFDTSHFATAGENLSACYSLFRDRVKNIHLSNFSQNDFQEHLPFDRGDLDLEDFLRRSFKMGFDGQLTLEVFPEFLQEHPDGMLGSLCDYMSWLEKLTGGDLPG
ncbi:MAG: sugar phosphate isomerase/epimerase [Thermoleophilia bacterium]